MRGRPGASTTTVFVRPPQALGPFVRGAPSQGYYNDLTGKALAYTNPTIANEALAVLLADPASLVPVDVAQLGLGSWQAAKVNPEWRQTACNAARGLAAALDPEGRLWHRWPVRHTYRLRSPWCSAMAQGQAVSLFLRVGLDEDDAGLVRAAGLASKTLVAESSELVRMTGAGPVLEEYPTEPASHVLNGWIFALWGLYDLACLGDTAAARSFDAGVNTLIERLPLYDVAGGWSRYDLFPHPLTHVASPFYHRLHVAQLEAMEILVDGNPFAATIRRWALNRMWSPRVGAAVTRKVAFRMLRPRGRRL
jgi:heparosan-N-sulfate-glucuronate 5-epimerase